MKTAWLALVAAALAACANINNNASPGGDEGGETAACNDGIDNDGDGLIDFPADPGCGLGLEDSEDDDCPDGPQCPACGNGRDDDGDGDVDYPDDTGCDTANDGSELAENPAACGGGVKLETLETDAITGTVEAGAASGLKSKSCGGAGAEVAFTFAVTRPSSLIISTDFPETELDTVIYLRSSCSNEGSELGCNDDAPETTGGGSTLFVERVEPGEYYVIVDGQFQGAGGPFKLEIKAYIGRDEACTVDVDECAPGLLCQSPTGGQATICAPPRCSDGVDNDGDQLVDYPDEPGCPTADYNDEVDDCPSGSGCPQCSNGMDDDGDGLIDMGDDGGCSAAGDNVEQDCDASTEDLVSVTGPTTSNTTEGATDDTTPSCRSSSAPDIVHHLSVPGALESLTADTNGSAFDTVLYMRAMTCEAMDMSCDDDGGDSTRSMISETDLAAGDYFIIVDGYSSNAGAYELNVSGVIKSGEPCDPAQVASGLLSCGGTTQCTGGMCQ